MRNFFQVKEVKLDQPFHASFIDKLDWENLERVKIIVVFLVSFFVLALIVDLFRINAGIVQSNPVYIYAIGFHSVLGLAIIPLIIYYLNRKQIRDRSFSYKRSIVFATIAIMGAAAIGMTAFGLYRHNSIIAYAVFILIVNLILTLQSRYLLVINLLSFVTAITIVLYLQQTDTEMLLVNSFEILAFTAISYFIAIYQYNLKANQYLNEQKIRNQQKLIEKSLMDQFNRRIAEVEMTALRAQMNPHFLFNCLNSIKLYMVQNDAATAATYLTKFSRLIRLILNNSKSKMVKLSKELEALELYIEMEQFRFRDKFEYHIEIDSDIDEELIDIPPLILQPYVENAIWHGLMHKEAEKGQLLLKIQKALNSIVFIIEDNGVGREKAKSLQSRSATRYKSFGTEITKDRIEIANNLYGTEATIEIIDLTNDQRQPCGTRVVILLPL